MLKKLSANEVGGNVKAPNNSDKETQKNRNMFSWSGKASLRIADSVKGCIVFRQRQSSKLKKQLVFDTSKSSLLNLNTVCPYYTMFPLDFPLNWLSKARHGEWVLDPFCGRGTTLFAARLRGLGSVGIDSNPIAAAIAAAKLCTTSSESVIKTAKMILDKSKTTESDVPEGEFWRMCYHPKTLREICVLRNQLMERCQTDEEIVLRALILGILHGPLQKTKQTYLSNQMPRTYSTKPNAAVSFWKKMGNTRPPQVNVLEAIERRAKYTLSRIPPPVRGAVYYGDARKAHKILPRSRMFNWVVTSPPYLGMRTYRPDQWLRNWFLGGDEKVEYGQEGQLSHQLERFKEGLTMVWTSIAKQCVPGARLIIRFGYLPSCPVDATEILRTCLQSSGVGWEILQILDAGSASNGNRQSEQFRRTRSTAVREIDIYARLEG